MHRVQNLFETQCLSGSVSDELLNEVTEKYVNDERMREWFLENNKYAMEEIARRLLELHSRGKWTPDADILENLQMNYLTIEGDMESGLSGLGEIQAGNVEIIADDKVDLWKRNLSEIDSVIKS
jgi:Cobalamin biosynthesis protein CobN and related Mg-chelatases